MESIAGRTPTTPRDVVEELVRRHLATVRGYLAALGCPAHLLDDLVQDVFLSVLASTHFEDRGPAATSAYLRKAARHLLLKTVSRERRHVAMDGPALDELAGVDAAWREYEADDGGSAYVAALRACLERVREKARAVIELRYGERLQRRTIAARLGLSEAGVKSILARTRESLRACIERTLVP